MNESKAQRHIGRGHDLWVKERDRVKTLWVIAVLAFWIAAAIVAVVYYLEGRFDLILVSITLGMMVLGLWLKTRYQLVQRKEPVGPDGAADGEDYHPGP